MLFLCYSSCLVEGTDNVSLVLSQVQEIVLVSGDTLLFQKDRKETLDYEVKYLDKNGVEVAIGNTIKPKLYLNGEQVSELTFDLNTVDEYDIYLALKTSSIIQSNTLKVKVINPVSLIKSITLSLSDSTNNLYAISGKSRYNFKYSIIGKDDTELGITSSLFLDGKKLQGFNDVLIDRVGEIPVYAEAYGIKSNVISIRSRQDIAYPKVRMPIIFHVFPNSKTVTLNQIKRTILDLNRVFDGTYLVNNSHRKHQSSVSVNIEFYLAETDPMNKPLEELGINRLSKGSDQIDYPINNEEVKFLFDGMWDPTKYLNIYVSDISGAGGFAYFPVLNDFHLTGVGTVLSDSQLYYPYVGVVTKEAITTSDDVSTLAHEIGHMLGLFHSFVSEDDEDCANLDYSLDTEDHVLDSYPNSHLSIDCEDKLVLPTDFMDYKGYRNSFTFDQRERMRRVLEYNPFLPTSKNNSRTKPYTRGKLDYSVKPIN